MMGRRYTKLHDNSPTSYEAFRDDEYSRFLFTYRKNFPQIYNTGKTTDRGWGCMLRTGQMLLGEALSRLFLGRDYHVPQGHTEETPRALWILRMFLDIPDRPFSLQRISTRGEKYDKSIGSWFGPSNSAHVLRDLLRAYNSPDIPLRISVMTDGSIYTRSVEQIAKRAPSQAPPNDGVYKDIHYPYFHATPLPPYTPPPGQPTPVADVLRRIIEEQNSDSGNNDDNSNNNNNTSTPSEDQKPPTPEPPTISGAHESASSSSSSSSSSSTSTTTTKSNTSALPVSFYPTLLLIVCSLGQTRVTPEAAENVRYFLSHPCSVGIIGGKPNSSYYFYATREEYVYYLNPHQTQDSVRDESVRVETPFSTKV